MKDSFYIKFNKIDTIYEFIESAKSISNRVLASQGFKTVDAKSIFDLLTLDLKQKVQITVLGNITMGELYKVRQYITKN